MRKAKGAMKTAFILSALLSLAYAAPTSTLSSKATSAAVTTKTVAKPITATGFPQCACAVGACPATQPAACECIQSAALQCWLANLAANTICPSPTFTPCPEAVQTVSGAITFGKRDKASPTLSPVTVSLTIPSAEPTATCTCDPVVCVQSWPESCICENNAKVACYDKCGGPLPTLVPCPIVVTPPASASNPAPTVSSTVYCGGLLGLACPKGMKCVDDPSDSCDPKNGGADCEGICI